MQLVADLTAFCLPALAAIVAFWAIGPRHPVLMVASFVEVVMVVGLATLIVLYADLQWRADDDGQV